MLEHGGRLHAAARRYGIPLNHWLDLSTGINPNGWPVPAIPAELWSRLPEADDELAAAAQACYGATQVLPLAGSQAAIQTLPLLRAPCRVAVMQPGYAEHAQAWQRAGHHVTAWPAAGGDAGDNVDAVLAQLDVVVVMQPNNPTGACQTPARLLDWHARLAARGGWLVVDEAFIDATPQHSLASYCARPGLIVLRSLGKFFGLAGARVGFALAEAALLDDLAERLGPWPIASPARWIAQQALSDETWQHATRARLHAASQRLAQLLTAHGLAPHGGCALFQWVRTPRASDVALRLAQRAILVRRFDEPASLRFGLPGEEAGWSRLTAALKEISP